MRNSPLLKAVLVGVCGWFPVAAPAAPHVDEEFLGKKFGDWKSKGGQAAEYTISGSEYRTWKPHVTPTADGGLFVSVRIDHLRGFLASDDHASMELSFDKDGQILTARSTIALQGRKITSDVIKGTSALGTTATSAERIMKVGTNLVADLTAKLLREKFNEPGRVGFPAALQHNYHLLCLAVRVPDPNDKNEAAPDLPSQQDGEAPGESSPLSEEPAVPPLQIDVQGKPVEPKGPPLPIPPPQP